MSPEPGLRLIKKDLIPSFVATMEQKRTALKDQVMNFDNNYYFNLRNDAEEKLGQLFNPEDYPPSLQGQFDISWEFHAVEPPIDLKTLYPAIYEQEQKKAQAKLEEAVTLAEQAFASELSAMLTHLTERLHAAPGEKKVFRDSAITNLAEFFDRFAKLKITNNAELDQIVKDAKIVLGGIEPQMLRDSPSLKKTIATEVGKLTQQLEGMIIKAPRRKIVIPDAQPEGSAA